MATWESIDNIMAAGDMGMALYSDWAKRAIPLAALGAAAAQEQLVQQPGADADYSGPMPELESQPISAGDIGRADRHAGTSSEGNSAKSCQLRVGDKFAHHTGGALYGFDACGYPAPPHRCQKLRAPGQ
eukprot:jgi/Chrzof1/2793/UNPLg00707.t1